MCAINGFNFNDDNLILKMNKITSHRGPDGTNVFCDDEISFGHNRLSIIDISESASQPMKSFDGKLIIVFNGEIYNFKELKKELIDYPFKTNSDTEVILAAYQKWGKDCVKKLNGIFAFAIWDKLKKELFLARDNAGIKPLYYFLDGKNFIFSSEIKAIAEHSIPKKLNYEAFNHYLRVLYVPGPLTMFDGVYKFPPASFGIFKNGKLNIQKYWNIGNENIEYFKKSKTEIAKELQKIVQESVESQLISDKPLGIYLSGGIDSSAILDSVRRVRGNVDTFSVGFDLSDQEEREKFNADFNLARKTADYYETNHNEIVVSSKNAMELIEKAIWHMDEPISNPTTIAMMKLAEFAKQKVDVVLGGDGGDELFGGYERYRLSLFANYYQKIPLILRNALNSKEKFKKLNILPGIDRFVLFMFQKDDILKRTVAVNILNLQVSKFFFENSYFANKFKNQKFEEIFMEADRKSWLVDYSLMLNDKMSMTHGLEQRVPLLDKNIIEFATKIPLKYKVNPFNTKIILKEAFKKRIPNFLFNQPKRGWFSPGAKWLRHPKMYKTVEEILSKSYCAETKDLFNWPELKNILKDHCDKKEYNFTIIWTVLTFQIWAKRFNLKI